MANIGVPDPVNGQPGAVVNLQPLRRNLLSVTHATSKDNGEAGLRARAGIVESPSAMAAGIIPALIMGAHAAAVEALVLDHPVVAMVVITGLNGS